jgi:protease-4
MRQFFKFLFASCLGTALGLGLLSLLFVAGIAGLSGSESPTSVPSNSILKLSLSEAIPELTNNIETETFSFSSDDTPGLRAILKAIEFAKTDDKIKGIYMEQEPTGMGMATRTAIRNALLDFKKSGKFIIAYNTVYSQGSYYLASAADKVYLNPRGGLEWAGMASQTPFFKGMFDKLGVKAQVYYAGKFKSATEPFRRTEMSPENKLQVRTYMEGFYKIILDDVAATRKIPAAQLRQMANDLTIRTPEDALKYKMVDGLMYKDQILDELRSRLKLGKKDPIEYIELGDYVKNAKDKLLADDGNIAVVFAEGGIGDGKSKPGAIGGDTYSELIRKIRLDENVKAIVLRVNSGGGSALASELIWRELVLARQQGKPVVVSMGDVAASGGYYIACNSDRIFAEPNTITGSIGVFGMIPNAQGLMRDKLGITYDTVKTSKYATMNGLYYEFGEDEGKIIQEMIDTTYQNFLQRVATGRKMTLAQVDSIAQGRVWTGTKALEIGLVDELGGLDAAIAHAKKLAKLTEYTIAQYPKSPKPIEQMLKSITGKDDDKTIQTAIRSELGDELFREYKMAKDLRDIKGVQALYPYSWTFK